MDYIELEESSPNKLLNDAIRAVGDWLQYRESIEYHGGELSFDKELILSDELRRKLRQLAVQARVWRMDVSALEEFGGRLPQKFVGDDRMRIQGFWNFTRQYQDEMEARWLSGRGSDEAIARHLRCEGDLALQAVPTKDGPTPPNSFHWEGRFANLEPIPWKLLNFLWKNRTVGEAAAIDAVWGHDCEASESDGPLKSALRKINRALDKTCCAAHASRKAGYVTLE